MKNIYSYLIAGSFLCLAPARANAGSSSDNVLPDSAQRRYAKTSGRLESVNLLQNKIILQEHDGASVPFAISPGSEIKVDGKEVAAGDLRAGQQVRLLRFSATHSIKRLDVSTK